MRSRLLPTTRTRSSCSTFRLRSSPARTSRIAELLRAEIPQVETILFQDRQGDRFELSGPGHVSYRVGDYTYRVGHLSFFQVNRFLLPELVQTVLGDAKGAPGA